MGQVYLIRYGLMRRVGRFLAESGVYDRGQIVVIRSRRGTELGEVLTEERIAGDEPPAARLLRVADRRDLEQADRAERERPHRLAACERVFQEGIWPLELIDVEPLLDDRRTVLHYLGPHQLDVTGLLQALRDTTDLDVMFEPAGIDADEEQSEADGGCGDCGGGGGCGSSGGCGSDKKEHGGGCSGCAVKDLVRNRQTVASH
jgi:cell fate regulator YaaT (PSP1 superfamily)